MAIDSMKASIVLRERNRLLCKEVLWKCPKSAETAEYRVYVKHQRSQNCINPTNEHMLKLVFTNGHTIHEEFWKYLWTYEGDPAAARHQIPWVRKLSTRETVASDKGTGSGSPLEESSLQVARKWLDDYQENHKSSLGGGKSMLYPVSQGLKRPSRLLKIVNLDFIQLVDGALDYKDYTISTSDLPMTLQHAVHVTHGLGIDHVWIDALCILQRRWRDDDTALNDWKAESVKMGDIYRAARVTIAADSSVDSKSGMSWQHRFRPGSINSTEIINILVDGRESHLFLVGSDISVIFGDIKNGFPATRAWCCKEDLLSPRLLHFGLN